MASYPTSVKSFTTKNAGDTIQPADVNDLQSEINAIEDGLLNATARLNSSGSTLNSLSVVGGSTLAGALNVAGTGSTFVSSTLAIGGVSYIFPTATPTSSGLALIVGSTGTQNTLKWAAPGQLVLIGSTSGTDSNASAANVVTFAISGLTAADSLEIDHVVESVTQQTAGASIHHVTDNLKIADLHAAVAISAGAGSLGVVKVFQRQAASTLVASVTESYSYANSNTGVSLATGLATAWTGAWTLALRHAGVTAGGQFRYRISVFKRLGQ